MSLLRKPAYDGVVHVVTYAGARNGWCLDMYGLGALLRTILAEEPRWDTPITCLWCARLAYDS